MFGVNPPLKLLFICASELPAVSHSRYLKKSAAADGSGRKHTSLFSHTFRFFYQIRAAACSSLIHIYVYGIWLSCCENDGLLEFVGPRNVIFSL